MQGRLSDDISNHQSTDLNRPYTANREQKNDSMAKEELEQRDEEVLLV